MFGRQVCECDLLRSRVSVSESEMLNRGGSASRQVSGPRPPVFVTRSDLGTEPESDCGGRNFSEEKICNKNLGNFV